jgi:hypothetical protein
MRRPTLHCVPYYDLVVNTNLVHTEEEEEEEEEGRICKRSLQPLGVLLAQVVAEPVLKGMSTGCCN